MKFGIVGNNDGPLYLLQGLKNTGCIPEFVGLQKPVSNDVSMIYREELSGSATNFFQTFTEEKLLKILSHYNIDLLINCFCNFWFDEILTRSFPVLNIHLSPLPKYRGRHPLQWALINGEKEFGFSIHKMTEKFDAGAIYWQEWVSVKEGMSVNELRTKLLEKLKDGFSSFLDNYKKGRIQPAKNRDDEATYIPRRYPSDSELTEWHDSGIIFRKVQALRSEQYYAYLRAGNQKIDCLSASPGKSYNQKVDSPFIKEIIHEKFKVVCLDAESVWLSCSVKDIRALHLNFEIQGKQK